MTTKKNNLLVVMLIIFLSGCSMFPRPDRYDQKIFQKNEKGIAIFQITARQKSFWSDYEIPLTYRLKKLGLEKSFQVSKDSILSIGSMKDYSVMMLDPGFYYIDYMTLPSRGNIVYWYPGPGIKKISEKNADAYLVLFGAFEVKAGKVYYFGRAHLPITHGIPFDILDETERVKKQLINDGFDDLVDKVEFKPFFQKGSVILAGKNGFQGVDVKEVRKITEKIQKKQLQEMEKVIDVLTADKNHSESE